MRKRIIKTAKVNDSYTACQTMFYVLTYKRRPSRRAFTLVETLLSILILAAASVVIAAVGQSCLSNYFEGQTYENAWRLADECMSRVEALGPANLVAELPWEGTFPQRYPVYHCLVTVTAGSSENLYEVAVVVRWQRDERIREIQLQSRLYQMPGTVPTDPDKKAVLFTP